MATKKVEPGNGKATKRKAPKSSPAPPESITTPVQQRTESSPAQEQIALKAYLLWEERGRPFGSAEEDWFRAKEQLGA
jgi:hypothetical protein